MFVKLSCLAIGLLGGLFLALLMQGRRQRNRYQEAEAMWMLYLLETVDQRRRARRNTILVFFFVIFAGMVLLLFVLSEL